MYFYVYVLQSQTNNSLYIGFTTDPFNRVKEHNQGLNKSTKAYKPWRLIYFEACLNKLDALRREKYLKTNQGSRMLKLRLREHLDQ